MKKPNIPEKIGSVVFRGEALDIYRSTYHNERTAIFLEGPGHSLFATLSVNLPEQEVGENEFFVKDWFENKELASFVLAKTGLFEDTGERAETGFVESSKWRFKKEASNGSPKNSQGEQGGNETG